MRIRYKNKHTLGQNINDPNNKIWMIIINIVTFEKIKTGNCM